MKTPNCKSLKITRIIILPVLLLLIIIAAPQSSKAQKISYAEADAKTYKYYLEKNWSELIKTGNKALRNGHDFYYLHLRLGIAYFEKKNYLNAATHFRKAIEMSPENAFTAESLYYSYLYSGRFDAAKRLAESIPKDMQQRIGYEEPPFVSGINIEYQYLNPQDYTAEIQVGGQLEQSVAQAANYFNLGLIHQGDKGNKIFHAYSRFNITNRIYNSENINLPSVFDENIRRHQYYLQYSKVTNNNWMFNLSGHYLYTRAYATNESQRPGPGSMQNAYLYDADNHSFVAALSTGKQMGSFESSIKASLAGLNNKTQMQTGIELIWFPLGNRLLSVGSELFVWQQFQTNTNAQQSLIFKPYAGFFIGKHIFLQPSAIFGTIENYTEMNAYIVNDNPNPLQRKYEVLLNINNKDERVNFFLKYEFEKRENTYTFNNEEQKKQYNNQTITGGILWYF
jgi:hypothetical protein